MKYKVTVGDVLFPAHFDWMESSARKNKWINRNIRVYLVFIFSFLVVKEKLKTEKFAFHFSCNFEFAFTFSLCNFPLVFAFPLLLPLLFGKSKGKKTKDVGGASQPG